MEHESRILEVAVIKFRQENWNFYRASKWYIAPWSALKETVVKASEHFDDRYNSEDV
jgi:hypothetical protein